MRKAYQQRSQRERERERRRRGGDRMCFVCRQRLILSILYKHPVTSYYERKKNCERTNPFIAEN